MLKQPFNEFLAQALRDFEKELVHPSDPKQTRRDATVMHRLRGATLFARFLAGKPPLKNERVKFSD